MPALGGPIKPRPDFGLVAAVLSDLGQLVHEDRERTGLTVDQQARAIGVTPDDLARLETGGDATTVACLRYLDRGR